MRPEVAARPGYRDRFLREARTAARVRHDNVVPVYHVGEDGDTAFIVMPLLEGESLEDRLKRDGRLPPGEAARVGREAAEGLAAAHAKGLIHRDVKPANLWLEAPDGRVKVLDFGLAREADADDGLSAPGRVLGSPAYMSPEQADGVPVDHRADLFGLGCVLYRCLTGQPAFAGKNLTAVLRAVGEHTPPPPCVVNPAVPPALSDLVMRMLAKDPADRPSGARRWPPRWPHSSPRPPARSRPPPGSRRRPDQPPAGPRGAAKPGSSAPSSSLSAYSSAWRS